MRLEYEELQYNPQFRKSDYQDDNPRQKGELVDRRVVVETLESREKAIYQRELHWSVQRLLPIVTWLTFLFSTVLYFHPYSGCQGNRIVDAHDGST